MSAPYGIPQQSASALSTVDRERVAAFMRGVFSWMTVGLIVTALVAAYIAGSPELTRTVVGTPFLFYGVIIAELGMVWYLASRVSTLSPASAGTLFLVYSALNGITFSVVLLAYTSESVASTFLVAAVMFAALAVYGAVTKRDLTAMGRFMFMGLVGLVLVSVLNIFWPSDSVNFALGVVGVIVFAGLTAWDTQRLQAMALAAAGPQAGSYAISGALSLYLNFVNLFLSLLRLFGRRR